MIIETLQKKKRTFDENSKEDLETAKFFFENHRWKDGCPFILEYPYLSVPDMIRDKLVHKALGLEFNRRHHWPSESLPHEV
jgi:hypothetical protein